MHEELPGQMKVKKGGNVEAQHEDSDAFLGEASDCSSETRFDSEDEAPTFD